MELPQTTLWLQMFYPSTNYETDIRAEMRIEDRTSGHIVARLLLTAEQVTNLISGRNVEVVGGIAPEGVRGYLGKELVHKTEIVPPGEFVGVEYGSQSEQMPTARAWAQARMDELNGTQDGPDWETFKIHKSQKGWNVRFCRWEEAGA